MKSRSRFRLLAVPLLTVMLLGCVPSLDAAVLNSPLLTLLKIVKEKRQEKEDERKIAFPLWNSNSLLGILWGFVFFNELRQAGWRRWIGVLGGALVMSRRKRSAKAA